MNKILLAHAAAAAAALCAGTAVVATRFVIGETDPISLVFYRYLISIICFGLAAVAGAAVGRRVGGGIGLVGLGLGFFFFPSMWTAFDAAF